MPRTCSDPSSDTVPDFTSQHNTSLPVSSPTRSAWQVPASKYATFKSSDNLPKHAQVCIIGTGLSGISTAYHLLTSDPTIRIVLLEARDFCSAASGRNGGHLTCDLYGFAPNLLAAGFTKSQVCQHAQFEIDNFNALSDLITSAKIECEYKIKTHLDVCVNEDEFIDATNAVNCMRSCGFDLPTVKIWLNPEASQIAGIQCHGVIEHRYSASINPYRLVAGLMDIIMAQYSDRIQLFTGTPVTEVLDSRRSSQYKHDGTVSDDDNDDARKAATVVKTLRGDMSAQNLVFATNGYTAALLPQFRNVIVPVRGQMISRLLEHKHVLNCSFAMGGEYLSQRPNGYIVLGGARRYAKDMEWDNADDSELSANVSSYLHNFTDQLAGSGSGSGDTMEWSGIMGFAKLGIPSVLELPRAKSSSCRRFVCAGFTGHGMPRIFLSARHVARLILNIDKKEIEESRVPFGYSQIKEMTGSDIADR